MVLSETNVATGIKSEIIQIADREKTIALAITRIRQTLDIDTIFRSTTEELRQALNCDRVVVYQFNSDWSGQFIAESVGSGWQSFFELFSVNGAIEEEGTLLENDRCVVKTWEDQEVEVKDTYLAETQGGFYKQGAKYLKVNNIYHQGFPPCYVQLLEKFQCQAYLTVPIFAGDRLWGLLASYQNSAPREWTANDIYMATQIGTQFGVAVQQAELLAQTQQQAIALREAKEIAEAASLAKSQFLANMSHELRTPLNAILGFTQLMNRDRSLIPDYRHYLEIISQSGEHLLGLINDVLDLSKIEAGRATLTESVFNLHKLLDNLGEMLQLKAESKDLDLILEIDQTVPKYIKTDEKKLRQILLNLVGNSLKFTDQGMVKITASMSPFVKNLPERIGEEGLTKIYFSVADSGPGIAPEEVGELFQAFKQTQTGLKSKEGTGLGLNISRKFVQLMGGDISVSSKLGEGTQFDFYIQVEVEKLESVEPEDVPVKNIIGLAPGQPTYRILIAEDNPTIRLLLVNLLRPLGFEVKEAKNGQDGLNICQKWHPHLIFMDLRMPILSGWEAVRKIREEIVDNPPIIIAVSASAFKDEREQILSIGCDDFVPKPFSSEDILAKLNEHLGVEYVYETPITNNLNSTNDQETSGNFVLNAEALTVMPIDWLAQLHQVAAQCDDMLALKLIDQIPPEHSLLIKSLTELIDNFQFEKVMSLTVTK